MILQFSWVAVMGSSDMNVFDERYSGSYIVFRPSDYSIALCKLNNSVSDAVTLGSRALWKHLFLAQQGQAMISPGEAALTGVSTLPSTGCLGFSDLYLGHQSGKNWNVGRKITRKNSIWKTISNSVATLILEKTDLTSYCQDEIAMTSERTVLQFLITHWGLFT